MSQLFGPLHAHGFPTGAVLIYCHKSGTLVQKDEILISGIVSIKAIQD